jgi:hypothetical protein
LQSSDPPRHIVEAKLWKIQSRIQLLSAKLIMHSDSSMQQALKEALAEQYDTKRELLAMDLTKAQDRLTKVTKDISDHDTRRETALKKEFDLLTATTARVNNNNKLKVDSRKKDKPAATIKPPAAAQNPQP